MNYTGTITETVRTGYRNLVGVSILSIVLSLTVLPLLATIPFGTVSAILGGLWTTCLLFGLALVSLFRFAVAVTRRGVFVEVRPHVTATVENPGVGLKLGAVTFVVIVGVLVSAVAVPDPYRTVAIGVALFVVLSWYLLVALASPELGSGYPFRSSLRAGIHRFGRSPLGTAWFLCLSFVSAVVAGLTLVTVVVLLPGALGLLATRIATDIASTMDIDGEGRSVGQ